MTNFNDSFVKTYDVMCPYIEINIENRAVYTAQLSVDVYLVA